MVIIMLHARQKKSHRCIEQTVGLYERRRGWDDLREQHQNMYIINLKVFLPWKGGTICGCCCLITKLYLTLLQPDGL